jgi:hypothetical protein
MATLKDLLARIGEIVRGQPAQMINPFIEARNVRPTPKAGSTKKETERKIRAGLKAYAKQYAGGIKLPIEQYIPMFVEATEKYPIFKQNPFLLPQVSILESSGGRNVTRENNPLNWGARIQKQGLYSPKSWEESINDAITAIAGDVRARPPSQPNRYRQTAYYEPFRRSGNIRDFANIYEPENRDYYDALRGGIGLFERQ